MCGFRGADRGDGLFVLGITDSDKGRVPAFLTRNDLSGPACQHSAEGPPTFRPIPHSRPLALQKYGQILRRIFHAERKASISPSSTPRPILRSKTRRYSDLQTASQATDMLISHSSESRLLVPTAEPIVVPKPADQRPAASVPVSPGEGGTLG